jgi:hypothetical protein
MRLIARGAALGGVGLFLAGGVMLFCGFVVVRAAYERLGEW